mgnify:CR=1 FL=1
MNFIKTFSKKGEALNKISDLGFDEITETEIQGGDTVESSAKIFVDILNGAGTDAQTNVVLCNAALAIQTIKQNVAFADCYYEAEEALMSKKALDSFKKLKNLSEIAGVVKCFLFSLLS